MSNLLSPPTQPALTPVQQAMFLQAQLAQAQKLLTGAPYNMFLTWKSGVDLIWKNPKLTPAQVVATIGTSAVELFSMSADFAALLEKHNPGITAATIALIGAFTVNPDGSVTVTPPAA